MTVGVTSLASLAYYTWVARGLYRGSIPATLGRAIVVMGVSALTSMVLLALMFAILV